MKKLKINSKEYNLPENWKDITMKTYCHLFYKLAETNDKMSDEEKQIITLRNEAKIISRLLDEDDDFCLTLPVTVFNEIRENIQFIYEINNFLNSKIFYLNIDGKKYFMPAPNEMSLRQYIDADIIMKEDNKNQFIELLACLLLPIGKDGKFEYDGKYQDLIPKIENMSAEDGLPFIYTYFKKKIISKKVLEDFSMVQEEANQLVQNIKNS